jgi:hypothetical protein
MPFDNLYRRGRVAARGIGSRAPQAPSSEAGSRRGLGKAALAVASQRETNEVKPMRYVYPLDPECPVVAEFMETLFGDPTMAMGAPVDDITEEFERRHRKQCKRCQEYGARQRVTE